MSQALSSKVQVLLAEHRIAIEHDPPITILGSDESNQDHICKNGQSN
jgi:hypothetical protein